MKINKLILKNYRNHEDLEIQLGQGLTTIVGGNGSGKTNIIEAINLLSTGKGFKATYDKETVNYKKQVAIIQGEIEVSKGEEGQKSLRLAVQIEKTDNKTNKTSKKATVNGKPVRIGTLGTTFNTVLFSPMEMNLLVNGPSRRRQFLDNLLSQVDETHKRTLSDYTKIRRQRNKVLENIRETGSGLAQLRFWNERLLKNGREIQKKRNKFFNYANEHLNNILKQLDPKMETFLKYKASPLLEERMDKMQPREVAAGTTLIGPHRDDFMFTSKEYGPTQDLANYASRGQQRTLIVALKLCELRYMEEEINDKPVLLLDDIFSELDKAHCQALEKVITGQQTIVTSTANTDFETVKDELIKTIIL